MWTRSAIIIVAVLIAAVRPFVQPEAASWPDFYKTAAHLFTGGLIGTWIASQKSFYFHVAVVLSLVELFFFIASRL